MKAKNITYASLLFIVGIISIHLIDIAIIQQFDMGAPEDNLQWWLYSIYILFVSSVPVLAIQSKIMKKNGLLTFFLFTVTCVFLVTGITPFTNQLYFLELPLLGLSNIVLLSTLLFANLRILTTHPH